MVWEVSIEPSKLCIKTVKEKTELIRLNLHSLNLLDTSRKIKVSGDGVLIPIVRPPRTDEFKMLQGLADVSIVSADLPLAQTRPKDLIAALNGTLPPHLLAQLPRSYDIVGDIAIIEDLSPDLYPHKGLVGNAIMAVHPRLKTVLFKKGKVRGDFRLPELEVLAGQPKFDTLHTEYGVRLKVDLSKAYFSPRLATEHHRVASQVVDGEVVVDMFAGVGPFSIQIAKKAYVKVYAIDINPYAISLLEENIKINRLRGEVIPILGDVRAFVQTLRSVADRVIMNLPASSLDYLDVATAFLKRGGGMLHIYVFAEEEPVQNAKDRLALRLSNMVRGYEVRDARIVKPVAPREWQVAIDAWVVP